MGVWRFPHDRTTVRRVPLPPDWLSIIAGTVTIVGFVISLRQNFAAAAVVLLALALATTGMAALTFTLRRRRFLPLNMRGWFASWALESDSEGAVFLTRPTGICPMCPPDSAGRMYLRDRHGELHLVCRRNRRSHQIRFDHTQLSTLDRGRQA